MNAFPKRKSNLKTKYPMLRYVTDRPFGVETEFFSLDYILTPQKGRGGAVRPDD